LLVLPRATQPSFVVGLCWKRQMLQPTLLRGQLSRRWHRE
jgi:hypothetical protein